MRGHDELDNIIITIYDNKLQNLSERIIIEDKNKMALFSTHLINKKIR